MSETIADLADELQEELNPAGDNISLPSIAFWLTNNIGAMNTLLGLSLSIDASNEISPVLTESQKVIYKKLYAIYYYGKLIRDNLGAAGFDVVTDVGNQGMTVRKVSKNEIAKSFIQLKKQEEEALATLILAEKMKGYEPGHVPGSDTIEGIYSGPDSLTRPSSV